MVQLDPYEERIRAGENALWPHVVMGIRPRLEDEREKGVLETGHSALDDLKLEADLGVHNLSDAAAGPTVVQ